MLPVDLLERFVYPWATGIFKNTTILIAMSRARWRGALAFSPFGLLVSSYRNAPKISAALRAAHSLSFAISLLGTEIFRPRFARHLLSSWYGTFPIFPRAGTYADGDIEISCACPKVWSEISEFQADHKLTV